MARAVQSSAREQVEEAAREKAAALKAQEEELRVEAEQANRRLWVIAAREKEVAITKALESQAAEVAALKAELENQRERAAQELEDAYHSMKADVGRVLEEQHSANVNMAVQAAWESAGRLQESAVAAARKEARAEAEQEWERRQSREHTERGEEARVRATELAEANASEAGITKEELRKLQLEVERLGLELERERTTAREAESKAAKKQQQAVEEAIKAVESVAKSSQERAIARALAAAGVKPAGGDAVIVSCA